MSLEVVVTGKNGTPVTDLAKDAFKIYENGTEQQLSVFEPPGTPHQPPQELPAGVFSNQDESADGAPLNIILIDALNLDVTNQLTAKREMLKYLDLMKPQRSRTAVFLLSSSLRLLQPFTSDLIALKRAIHSYSPQSSSISENNRPPAENDRTLANDDPLYAATIEGMIADLRQFENEQATASLDRRVAVSLEALRSVARSTSGNAGRKNLLWVTGGFPLSLFPERARTSATSASAAPGPAGRMATQDAVDSMTVLRNYDNELQLVSNALADAHIAVYPIDARLLMATTDPSLSVAGMQNKTTVNKNTAYADELARASFKLRNTQETMAAIAEETGGRAFTNTNDMVNALVIGSNESAASYTLGYYPSSQKWDGKFRNIRVTLNQPGHQLRYRPGYYALDRQKKNSRDKDEEFKAAIWDPLPATELVFSAHPLRQSASKLMIEFLVPASQIAFQPVADDKRHVDMDFSIASIGKDGKLLNLESKNVSADLKADVMAKIETAGLPFRMPADLKPEIGSFRLIVRDKTSLRIGRIDVSLK